MFFVDVVFQRWEYIGQLQMMVRETRFWESRYALVELVTVWNIICAETRGSYCVSSLEKECPLVWASDEKILRNLGYLGIGFIKSRLSTLTTHYSFDFSENLALLMVFLLNNSCLDRSR